jgi:hypothetical protein
MIQSRFVEWGGVEWFDGSNEVRLWVHQRSVVLYRCKGRGLAGFAPLITASLDRLIERGIRPRVFDDSEEMTGFDPDYRVHLRDWVMSRRESLAALHIVVRSSVVAMGVATANRSLGGAWRVHAERRSFDAALHTALGAPADVMQL